ncbi:MAG: hypothetical protein PHH04_07830 [Thomasclavelia sp.]|nr:hypothetical protein [Thomasclavelia sp.]
MEKRSYEEVYNINTGTLKLYLLKIGKGAYQDELLDLIMFVSDNNQLQKALSKRKDIQLWLFSILKREASKAKDYNELEVILAYMNIIFDKKFKPLYDYKYFLSKQIIKTGFDIDNYCLLRHLIRYSNKILEEFIVFMAGECDLNVYKYHYMGAYINLLEGNYKQAFIHLNYIEIDDELKVYDKALANSNPLKYLRLMSQKEKKYDRKNVLHVSHN